jgi:hypothetical protein
MGTTRCEEDACTHISNARLTQDADDLSYSQSGSLVALGRFILDTVLLRQSDTSLEHFPMGACCCKVGKFVLLHLRQGKYQIRKTTI